MEEQKAGNTEFDSAAKQTMDAMKAMESPELDWFIEHALPAFSLNHFDPSNFVFNAPFSVSNQYASNQVLNSDAIADITSNGAIHEGDQLTIVYCQNVIFYYVAFVIAVGGTIPVIGSKGEGGLVLESNSLTFDIVENINAAAVILSRKNGTKYERSTAYLALNEESDFIKEAYSTQAINAALATYQSSVSVNNESTDWPVEPEDDGTGSGTASISAPYVLSGLAGAKAALNGRKVLVFENANTGDLTSVGTLSGYLVDFETYQTLVYMQDAVYMALVPTDVTALASLPHHEINAGI